MTLNNHDKKQYRSIAHALTPVVTIAQKGLSDNVNVEIERALSDHELIKIKIYSDDRDQRKSIIALICQNTHAELVQSIGNKAVLFRASTNPNPKLSNLIRHKSGQI